MGGKPGQSKGCNTCRRRKKGCDLQRPFCGQCLKSGNQCAGYARETKFINIGKNTSSPMSLESSHSRLNHESIIQLPTKFEQSAFRSQCYGAFLDFYLPSDNTLYEKEMFTAGSWVKSIPDLAINSPALAYAFDALATARLAQTTNDPAMLNQSAKSYGNALCAVKKAVESSKQGCSTETLASIMVLALYEVYGGSTERSFGWTSHVQAAAAIIQQKQNSSNVSQVDQLLLLGLRLDGITQAIGKRKASILSEPDWTIPPWSEFCKGPTHQLVDIMFHLPSIMENADTLRTCSDVSDIIFRATALAKRCREIWTNLEMWRSLQKCVGGLPRYWRKTSSFPPPTGNTFYFAECICFSDLATAYGELLYWTSLLLLYSMHCMTCASLRVQLGFNFDFLPTSDDPFSYPGNHLVFSGAHSCALRISQSLEYFIKPEMGGLGAGLLGFPMAVAMGYFRHIQAPELAWCRFILAEIRRRYGIPLDTFLDNMFEAADLTLIKV